MRETKAHYRSRAGIEPISRDCVADGKKFIIAAIDKAIAERWPVAFDDERSVLKAQRERVAKFLGVT